MLCFGTAPYEDGFRELYKLKQTTTVKDYHSRFERLLGKAGALTDKQKTTCFINGLREPLRADLQAQNPTTISLAISRPEYMRGKLRKEKKGTSPTHF